MKFKVAPNIDTLVPYPPGKPLEELEREYGISGSIKLASNENAWGPSPKAVAAIKESLGNLHRYFIKMERATLKKQKSYEQANAKIRETKQTVKQASFEETGIRARDKAKQFTLPS